MSQCDASSFPPLSGAKNEKGRIEPESIKIRLAAVDRSRPEEMTIQPNGDFTSNTGQGQSNWVKSGLEEEEEDQNIDLLHQTALGVRSTLVLSPFSPLPSPTNFFAVLSLMEPTHMNGPIGFCVRTDEQVFFF